MKILKISLLLISLISLRSYALTVCGITINSDNEFKAFQRAMGPGIKAVELIRYKTVNGLVKFDETEWMEEACRQKVQCDVVVLSAHFGGIFGAENMPIRLSLETMERASCSNQCTGIYQHPKEVYLLGCYAAQTQEVTGFDLRKLEDTNQTPGRLPPYLQMKYSNLERLRRIFPNTPRIYGYAEKGPLGAAVERNFGESISRQKNYYSQLPGTAKPNLLSVNSARLQMLTQFSGSDFNPDLRHEAQNICIGQWDSSLRDTVRATSSLLLQGNGIKHVDFVAKQLLRASSEEVQALLPSSIASQLAGQLEKFANAPSPVGVRLQSLELQNKFGFKSDDQTLEQMKALVSNEAQKSKIEWAASAVCAVADSVPTLKNALTVETLSPINTFFSLELIRCTKPRDPALRQAVERTTFNEHYLNTLAHKVLKRWNDID